MKIIMKWILSLVILSFNPAAEFCKFINLIHILIENFEFFE